MIYQKAWCTIIVRDQDQNIKYLSVYYSIEKVNTQCSSMVQWIFTARAKAMYLQYVKYKLRLKYQYFA